MRFYSKKHAFTCGVDLHTRTMFLFILDQAGEPVLQKNMPSTPAAFLIAVRPFREDLAVGVECIFTWYWLANLCREEGIPFILGHALSMKASGGAKVKNDKAHAYKIACLLQSGMLPMPYRPIPLPVEGLELRWPLRSSPGGQVAKTKPLTSY